MMGRTDIARKDILNPTYLKDSAHNLKKQFFSTETTHNYENLWEKKFNLNTGLFSGLKNSPTFFFETFLERLLTNLSLKLELTETTLPIRQLNLGSCYRPILKHNFHSR